MTRRPSNRIIERVAEESEQRAHALPPLFEAIEVEALDRLVTRLPDDPRIVAVEFHYVGYRVTVFSDHTVSVVERDERESFVG